MTDIELIPGEPIDETDSAKQISVSAEESFDDLNLAELLGLFLRAPRETFRALVDSTYVPPVKPRAVPAPIDRPDVDQTPVERSRAYLFDRPEDTPKRLWSLFGLYVSGFMLALWGGQILVSAPTRSEEWQLNQGAPLLILGFVTWLGAEIYRDWPAIKRWWDNRSQPSSRSSDHEKGANFVGWTGIHPIRVFAAIGTLVFGILTWLNSANNQFTFIGFWAWMLSIVLIVVTFAPSSWNPVNVWAEFRRWLQNIRLRGNFTLFLLILITLIAAIFRLQDLDAVPPEMTSDHIEKLLDSWRVAEQGDRDIFFVNNGGREPFQMYALALLSKLPGLGINFTTLKLLAVIESLVTIPVLWWAGREVIGERNRRLGNIVGLILAVLVAVSYWHVAMTRLSLRIVLTPLVASLLLAFLSRGMRRNRTEDFILAGLVLGFGLYTYQAARMLPIVVVIGVFIASVFHFGQWARISRYIQNLLILVIVSFVVFVPLFRFSTDFPEAFWMRTAGRLLGDDIIQEVDAAGNIVERNATIEERLDAFEDNLPILTDNIRNALLMYNWKGDVAWINGVPNYPVMDSITGAFLIVGLAAWVVLTIRLRDPVFVLVPVMVFIMLLPSALSIAAPLENPSATRTSGSLPPVYLIAALPFALMVILLRKLLRGNIANFASLGMAGVFVFLAYTMNADTYFNDYRKSYERSWKIHSAPGQVLEGFATSDGSYGNAFIIHYEHWLDHRIVGLEGGIIDWQNAIISRDKVPDFLNDAWRCVEYKYRLDPHKDILFFYNAQDDETEEQLEAWFPDGRSTLFAPGETKDNFKTYRIPALGDHALDQWIADYRVDPRCDVQTPS